MIHISDSARVFPLQSMPYLGLSISDLYAEMLTLKKANCPSWTDDSPADLGNQLIWLFCVLSDMTTAAIERSVRNCFIGSTQDREVMRELCRVDGYTLSEATAASAIVTFACAADHPEFTIAAGTRISTVETRSQSAIYFETGADQVVLVGVETVGIVCVEGETIAQETIGSSDGTTDQRSIFARKPVIWHSETIEVNDNAAWAAWTRVDDFVSSDADDHHYRVEVDSSGLYTIVFGNGVRGRIPIRGVNNIRATYRIGGGVRGNVAADAITEIATPVQYVDSVTNAAAASGGTDREALEHARIFGPANLRAIAGGVTTDNIESLARGYVSTLFGGVANAKAFTAGGFTIRVTIVPAAGGLPSTGLKSELQTYLNTKRMTCTAIQVADPVYHPINVTVTVNAFPNYSPSQIAVSIRERLVAYLSPTYQDPGTGLYPHGFGRNVYISDLYTIIDSTPGVDYCMITLPTANVSIGDFEIADIGALSITVTTPTGESSHFELGQ